MDPTTLRLIQGAAGAAAAGATYVDDLFNTDVWDGTGSAQTITNGIDLDGEGGMVWTKVRNYSDLHTLMDSERGKTGTYFDEFASDSTYGSQTTRPWGITSFNSNGFSLGGDNNQFNSSSYKYCSWTFRKTPGFFDIIQWTGNSTAGRTISHNLGSAPGAIFVKRTDGVGNWSVFHRKMNGNGDGYMHLNNENAAQSTGELLWGDGSTFIAPTSTTITLGSDSFVNYSGYEYIAYIFAHDEAIFGENADQSVIKCGSYNANNSSSGNTIDVGFEPQWVLIKSSAIGGTGYGWTLHDNMRDRTLFADSTNQDTSSRQIDFTPTGFHCIGKDSNINDGFGEYIYIAIRRPNKPPTAATDVFDIDTFTGSGSAEVISTTFTVDASLTAWRNRNFVPTFIDRLRGGSKELFTAGSQVEYTNPNPAELDFQTGLQLMGYSGDAGYNLVSYSFKRAPGFFDVVTYSGTGSARTQSHNLAATPELIIVRTRSHSANWYAYVEALGNQAYLVPNKSEGASTGMPIWNSTSPTSSVFSLYGSGYNVNESGKTYVAYLFATLDGISKVGSYSGTGSNIDVDCGFAAGARFVLIKRTDGPAVSGNGDWYVFLGDCLIFKVESNYGITYPRNW